MTEPSPIPPDDHPDRWHTVRHFAYVDRAFRDVRRLLTAAPTLILGQPGEPPTWMHVHRGALDFGRDVRMVLGEFQVGIHSARLHLRWEDGLHPGLFPIFDGTFEVSPVAGRRPMTQLALFGRYQPPFGRLGTFVDTVAGHRIVLESLEAFLDDLAHRLDRELPTPPP